MLLVRLHKFLTAPSTPLSRSRTIFWFSLSLTFAVVCGAIALGQVFDSEYAVQDDARQHVFWMWRFVDPALFPNDFIADYYESVAPPGYATFYRLAAMVGLNPVFVSKAVPAVLGIIATIYCFAATLQILPVPMAGFIATLILNQNLWLKDDLSTGIARAFMYPIFLAFLYYLLRRSLLPFLASIVVLGLFYPQTVLNCAAILVVGLIRWRNGRPALSTNRQDYLFCEAGLLAVFFVLLPYVLAPSEFGSAVPAAEARQMVEFSDGGRNGFFLKDPWAFWFYADRSGLFPLEWYELSYKYFPVLFVFGLLSPLMRLFPARFPLTQQVSSKVWLLPQVGLASLGLFLASHALLFNLYLPGRYMQPVLRSLLPLMAGVALTVLLDGVLHWAESNQSPRLPGKPGIAIAIAALLGINLLFYPVLASGEGFKFPDAAYLEGRYPDLYRFLAAQPKDTLTASLERETSSLPIFTQRPILVSREYAISYHDRYYAEMRQRSNDLIQAQYSPDPNQVKHFIQKYGVDFWLIDRDRLRTPFILANRGKAETSNQQWISQYAAAAEADAQMKRGVVPVVAQASDRCSVLEAGTLLLLDANCIVNPVN